MEIKNKLNRPYTEKEKINFIVENNHNLGYEIKETEKELQAWGYTENEVQEQKKQYISNLTCTKRVFALILQEKGISYSQLKEIISSDEQAQLEWDLCEKLERKNPLFNKLAEKFGLKITDIDEIFKNANM